jgi:DNA invertase Pin-like site-specific DNA recombinase
MTVDQERRANAGKSVGVYVRVSTGTQDVASQVPDLKRWLDSHAPDRRVNWYQDTFTGRTLKRPGMEKLETDIRAGRVNKLVVWRLDRLGRTVRELLAFLHELERLGVEFVSVQDGVDASSATGRLMRTILAAFAEYEREVISERIRAGVKRAQKEGKRWGGKKIGDRYRLTDEKVNALKRLVSAGTPKAAIARQLGVSESTVYRALRDVPGLRRPSARKAIA